jgi:hypothetical protein
VCRDFSSSLSDGNEFIYFLNETRLYYKVDGRKYKGRRNRMKKYIYFQKSPMSFRCIVHHSISTIPYIRNNFAQVKKEKNFLFYFSLFMILLCWWQWLDTAVYRHNCWTHGSTLLLLLMHSYRERERGPFIYFIYYVLFNSFDARKVSAALFSSKKKKEKMI